MLLIGVLTSIFTAVVVTRAMLGLLSGYRFMSSPRVLGAIGSGDRWKKYDLIGKAKLWFAISGVVHRDRRDRPRHHRPERGHRLHRRLEARLQHREARDRRAGELRCIGGRRV